MVLNEERECAVCFQAYTRHERIPRVLHCNHTFCSCCLQIMSNRMENGLCSTACPFCRWITCTRVSLTLSGSLFINTEIWDQITEDEHQQELEVDVDWGKIAIKMQPTKDMRCSLRPPGLKSRLTKFLKHFSCVARPARQSDRTSWTMI